MPEAGWYPDFEDDTRVRLWDGEQWTGDTRPADGNVGNTIVVERPARSAKWLIVSAAVAGVAVAGLLAAQVLDSASPSENAANPSTAAGPASAGLDCSYADRHPGPVRVIQWLNAHGAPAEPAGDSNNVPSGACRTAPFRAGSTEGNVLIAYPNVEAAKDAAKESGTVIVDGNYHLTLANGVSRERYASALHALVQATSG